MLNYLEFWIFPAHCVHRSHFKSEFFVEYKKNSKFYVYLNLLFVSEKHPSVTK